MRKLLALAMLAGSLLVAVLLPAPALAQAQVVEPCCATILEGYRRSSWNASQPPRCSPQNRVRSRWCGERGLLAAY